MRELKLLWVEDDKNFGPSIHFRIENEIKELGFTFSEPQILTSGEHICDTIRDWTPDLIMMDHNLEDVTVNGANLIIEIRFQNHDTPIIFYSSEMGENLMNMVQGENEIYTSTRADVHSELQRLIEDKFKL
tara:strand:- start:1499 stop:1891 length:393 start_codon:yes stop_codon:yes gene_type:complete